MFFNFISICIFAVLSFELFTVKDGMKFGFLTGYLALIEITNFNRTPLESGLLLFLLSLTLKIVIVTCAVTFIYIKKRRREEKNQAEPQKTVAVEKNSPRILKDARQKAV